MNFSEKYKNGAELDGIELDEISEEEAEKEAQERTVKFIDMMAKLDVYKFMAYDKELFNAGFTDSEERLRIIEVIY